MRLYVLPMGRAAKTVEMYQCAVARIAGGLGGIPVDQLTPLDVMRYLVPAHAAHQRAAEVDQMVIKRAMRCAVKLGLSRIVLDEDTCPRLHHRAAVRAVLSPRDYARYLVAAQREPEAPLLLLCLIGLRRGEALGVQPGDIADGVLHVQRQRQRCGRVYRAAALKSAAADRLLILPEPVRSIVEAASAARGEWLLDTSPEALTRAHWRVMSAIGCGDVTLHGLRHSFATIAAAAGCSMKLLQIALGHSEIGVTADLYAAHDVGPSAMAQAVITSLGAAVS